MILTIDKTHIAWLLLAVKALIIPMLLISAFLSRFGKSCTQWFSGIRGRDWPTVSASVDVVTVVKQTEQGRSGERTIGYLATLTYFYRNPELQTGDYCRMFDNSGDGQAWAASFKGRTVLVHVDPHDPSRSVLRTEEI